MGGERERERETKLKWNYRGSETIFPDREKFLKVKKWPQGKDKVKGTMLRSYTENSERFKGMFKDSLRNKR